MVVQNPWSRHYQAVWEERAADRGLPLWLRIAALAYGKHRANGHAAFGRGMVALTLGTPPSDHGPAQPVDSANLRRALNTAVQRGWLASGSSTRCLVVPAHAITGGLGNPSELCPVHDPQTPDPGRRRLRVA